MSIKFRIEARTPLAFLVPLSSPVGDAGLFIIDEKAPILD
jgi:hypothetical protein